MDTGKLKQKTKEISFEITGGNIPATQIMPLIMQYISVSWNFANTFFAPYSIFLSLIKQCSFQFDKGDCKKDR